MRTKSLLLLLILTCGGLYAQVDDTIRSLMITETRIDDARRAYVEVSNLGTEAINLQDFELGLMLPWETPLDDDYNAAANNFMRFPAQQLAPGASFVISAWRDWAPEMWLLAPEDYDPNQNKREMLTLADMLLHASEAPRQPTQGDSVSTHQNILVFWGGRECLFIRQHIYDRTDSGDYHVDSVLIDQVNGIWRGTDGTRWGGQNYNPVDVAGFPNGSRDATLVRKFSYKEGNMNFDAGRGETPEESEWITIPHQTGRWADNVRRLFWTVKNHGDYNLTAETLVSTDENVVVNFEDSTITVPWGVRRDDSIMFKFEYTPGLAWHYDYNDSYADSASMAAKTGDVLTVYACGNDADIRPFTIIVADPTESAKMAVPKKAPNANGFYAGIDDPVYMITEGLEQDYIGSERFGGIPFGTRVDTLLKYIEIPANAEASIEWVGGVERTDLQDGDVLVVTAEDGSTKEYEIRVDGYRKSHNAYLSAINWPDMPEAFVGNYGFKGDTIPNFNRSNFSYIAIIPSDVDEFPVLLPHREDFNSKVTTTRAQGLEAGITGRTIKFEVTAEDDTTINTYSVQIDLEITGQDNDIYNADPFISEFVFREQWANNFIEVVNPGNRVLDLSNYMFVWGQFATPAAAIQSVSAVGDFANRYTKYIPGYKWVEEDDWNITPGIAEPHVDVDPIVLPGDVFVVADIRGWGDLTQGVNNMTYETWWAPNNSDIDLGPAHSPFGAGIPGNQALWFNASWFLFKIMNDSILSGVKPATDPNDFQLIDVFGSGDGSQPNVGGAVMNQQTNYRRKPTVQFGNPEFNGSFGTDAATSEWEMKDLGYYDSRNVPWALNHLMAAENVGVHFMYPATQYRSTVTSLYYNVSPGDGDDQTIAGIVAGSTVQEITDKLVKIDENQTFLFKSNGDTLKLDGVPADGDSLIVTSADLNNKTFYILGVGEGLGRDATLTSDVYAISEEGNAGTVSEIETGTTLTDVLGAVEKAEGAKLTVLDAAGNLIPKRYMGYDSAYVNTLVNNDMYFEVISESRLDTILYKLELIADASSAFVISTVYSVNDGLISNVPEGTSAAAFLANLIPSQGATIKLVDKLGFERVFGDVAKDDILEVTSEDESITQSYYIQFVGTVAQLAYVVSDVYIVDQVDAIIYGDDVTDLTTVAAFKANLTASSGATFEVTNANGQPKNSGNLAEGDLVIVTGTGAEKTYVIDVITGINNHNGNGKLVVYPNPSDGNYTISGVKAGNRIQMVNITGAIVLDKYATGDNEPLRIQKEKSGVYFITVTDNNKVVGRYKVVKE